jgi:precorrin-6A/cobalt-precorrin-6A reductase
VNVLLLAGTGDAIALAARLAEIVDITTTASFAGRTTHLQLPPRVRTRVGGFGGIAGLRAYLVEHAMDVVIDAVHPYAKQMHHHAAAACEGLALPILGLMRPAWPAESGDLWYEVPDFYAAAARARLLGQRIFLTIGRQELAPFAACEDRWFLIRSIDVPHDPLPPQRRMLLQRGPFTLEHERELLRTHAIDLVVSKNSGGRATFAKIEAARMLAIPVLMVRRPVLPSIPSADTLDGVFCLLDALRENAQGKGLRATAME